MKKGFQLAALCLSFCMVVGGISGCGGEEGKAEGAKKTIHWVANVPNPDKADMVSFVEEKFDVDLVMETVSNTDALAVRFASGDIPDVFALYGSYNMEKYQKQNLLAQIPEDMLKEHAPTLLDIYEKDYTGTIPVMDYCKIDGKIYALPSIEYSANFHIPIVYRGDWLAKLGIDKLPETLEEFEAAAYKIANNDPDGNGVKDTYGISTSAMNAIYGAFGYQVGYDQSSISDTWRAENGKLVFGPVQPKMKEALTILRKWYADGVLDPEYITGENTGGNVNISNAFLNGTIGITCQGNYSYYRPSFGEGTTAGPARTEMMKLNPEMAENIQIGLPPEGPYGDRGMFQWNMYNGSTGFGKQLDEDPDKLAKILDIVEFGVSDYDNWCTMHYGIKGTHWEESPIDGTPVMKDGYEINTIGAGATFLVTIPPRYRRQAISEGFRKWTEENRLDEYGITNDLLITLPSEQKYTVELKKLQEEAYFQIITGLKPVDYFDEFVEKWYASGGNVLEKEANEWYASIDKQ